MAKGWTWSYSKFKNFVACPKRNYEVDIAKNYTDSSEQLVWGNEVHKALADACTGKAPLPDSMKDYQRWVDEMVDKPGRPGKLLVEQKLALTEDFQATSFFANNVWYRGVCDVARIHGDIALARDWKTGKILDDSRQLMLMAQLLFVHNPLLKRIKTEFVWLKDDCVTGEWFARDTIMRNWPPVLDVVKQMKHAADTMTYLPIPGRLCARYCPVLSCPFHGKSHR
jgi:hypothetical protein